MNKTTTFNYPASKYKMGDTVLDLMANPHEVQSVIPDGHGGWDYRMKDGTFWKETELTQIMS